MVSDDLGNWRRFRRPPCRHPPFRRYFGLVVISCPSRTRLTQARLIDELLVLVSEWQKESNFSQFLPSSAIVRTAEGKATPLGVPEASC
ncbi:hypothetical protein BQ8482_180178 [Mesorhizobium delmotii]|uniref:Uncharacterized protein n=1 Tax=Mesorhizobium delmotii TaxID=1631247 RepID=A0A2P9AII8_9HYPH|nr:hypothetical protein BQ8482_180178 [Mesorhizobium delmotii]